MPEDDKPEVEVEIPSETTETQESVEVDITPEAPKPAAKAEPAKPAPAFDERRIHNAVGFQVRQQMKAVKDELLAEIRALKDAGAPKQQVADAQQELDELDKVAQKDWKQAVRMLAAEEAKKNLDATIKVRQEEENKSLKSQAVERARSFVLSQYPQLSDDASEESRYFAKVWTENPSLWTNPEGYRLAMYEMEEQMRATGRTPKRVKVEVDKEVRRQLRANASNTVGLPTGKSNGKYILSREQQEIAKNMGIPLEEYAKTAAALENKEDISI